MAETVEVHEPRAETAAQWAARMQAKAPLCTCGGGERILLRAHHRSHGVPKYLQGHHSTPLRRAYAKFRREGYMLLGEVCRMLGISTSAYLRMEAAGKVPKAARRKGIGGWTVRVFKDRDVNRLAGVLGSRRLRHEALPR